MSSLIKGKGRAWLLTAALAMPQGCGRPVRPQSSPAQAEVTPHSVEARLAAHRFPRLALQLQLCCRNAPTLALFSDIAWWDLAIVDSEAVRSMADYLGPDGRIRGVNPNAVLLAYFSPADFIDGMSLPIYSSYRSEFDTAWLLKDIHGKRVPLYQMATTRWTETVNLSTPAQRLIPEFLNRQVIALGRVDGMLYDWASTSISWLNHRRPAQSGPIDINGDGRADSDESIEIGRAHV